MKYLLILIACLISLCTNWSNSPTILEVSAGYDIVVMKNDTIKFSGIYVSNNDIEIFNWYILTGTKNSARLSVSQTQEIRYIAPDSACTLSFIFQVKAVDNVVVEDTVMAYIVHDTVINVNAGQDQNVVIDFPVVLHATYTGDNITSTFWKIGSDNFVPASTETTFIAPKTPKLLPCIFKVTTGDNREAADTINLNVISLDSLSIVVNAGNDTSAIAGSELTLHGTYKGKDINSVFWKIGRGDFTPAPLDTTITLPDSPAIIRCVLKVKNDDWESLDTVKIIVLPNIPDTATVTVDTNVVDDTTTLKAYAGEDQHVTADSTVLLEGLGLDTANPNNAIVKYEWKYGNGLWIVSVDGRGTYNPPDIPGPVICSLRVTAYDGQSATDFCIINVLKAIDMVLIPSKGKTFVMGKTDDRLARPVHNVTFTKNFFMSRTEITQKEYVSLLDNMNPSPIKDDNYPVHNCNWFDAVYYCNARSKSEKMDTVYSYTSISGTIGYGCHMDNVKIDYTKRGYRLPTESEWEFACRGGTKTDFYWGSYVKTRYLWYKNNSLSSPRAVGRKLPNSFGLYDMSGNVKEWCNDWFDDYTAEDKVDPKGPNDSPFFCRVVRNGSYKEEASKSYSFNRIYFEPHTVDEKTGFRIVLEQ